MSACYQIHESEISHNAFDDEVIVVNLATGSYFSLHHAAAEIWRLLQPGPVSAESLAASFAGASEVAAAEIQDFLDELARQNLIVPTAEAAATLPASIPYSAPVLESFDELRELLMADIIHDTDEQGWPHVAPSLSDASDRAAWK